MSHGIVVLQSFAFLGFSPAPARRSLTLPSPAASSGDASWKKSAAAAKSAPTTVLMVPRFVGGGIIAAAGRMLKYCPIGVFRNSSLTLLHEIAFLNEQNVNACLGVIL